MKCKCCGTPFQMTQTGLGGVMVQPNCKCGKIRKREREKGCTKCGAHGVEIQIQKKWYGWMLACTCGHKWRVRK